MRTQSRHTTTSTKRSAISRYSMLIVALASMTTASVLAGPVSDRLDLFVSRNADAVISSFGSPALTTNDRLSYAFNVNPAELTLGQPKPVDQFVGGNSGATGSGLALRGPATGQAALPCVIDFYLDNTSIVEKVSYRGPGCYEVVYSRTIQQ